jgi:aryl-alcohol dehydrogenase-like predicted oxidoreductase
MIHWPVAGMRPEEMMAALNQVVSAGKARYVGCCNYPAWLLAHSNAIAQQNGWPQLVCNQIAYNLIERGVEIEILPQAVAGQIAITAYRPLVAGLLAGKYRAGQSISPDTRAQTDTRLLTWLAQFGDRVEKFNQMAAERNLHPAQLAIAWVRSSPAVTAPIVGVSSLSQLETSLGAFEIDLTAGEVEELNRLFDTEIYEEGIQLFPGLKYNFPRLRRNLTLLG